MERRGRARPGERDRRRGVRLRNGALVVPEMEDHRRELRCPGRAPDPQPVPEEVGLAARGLPEGPEIRVPALQEGLGVLVAPEREEREARASQELRQRALCRHWGSP